MQWIIGALIFAVGAFFGAVLYGTAQRMRVNQKDQFFKSQMQDRILQALDQTKSK